MFNFLISAINGLISILGKALSLVLALFPPSPFQIDFSGYQDWIGVLNYFLPIGAFLGILTTWLSAIAIYYMYQIVMRWVKVVG